MSANSPRECSSRHFRAAYLPTEHLSENVEVNQNEIDLAREDLQTLHAISSTNRPVTTTTIKEQLHWADSGSQVRYRLDKLEERGLIETRKDEERAKDHQMPPRVAVTTSAGDEVAAEFEDNPGTLPVEKRVSQLETQLQKFQQSYNAIKGRIVELEEQVEQHDEDLDSINSRVDDLVRAIDASQDAGDAE